MYSTVSKKAARGFRPQGCLRCGGSAYLDRTDEPEWRCLQCGRPVPQAATELKAPRLATAA
jgi:hypothetical protein